MSSAGVGGSSTLLRPQQPAAPEILDVGIPNNREVDDKRLGASVEPAEVELLTEADFDKNPWSLSLR
ncbi:hypothetical protein [Nocardia callitridis]|uniref:Uncharacterized protein n=1 Tax=Nocardia callitridis TaxID=648753 RepID=A0ABP9L1S5_9NOCA